MIRSILGSHQDAEGDWVAEMPCFHNRHVRHDPPFREAAWVLEEGDGSRTSAPPSSAGSATEQSFRTASSG